MTKKSQDELAKIGTPSWPTWGCGVSTFPWYYDSTEQALILEGSAVITPKNSALPPVEIGPGDYCVFPEGLECEWKVTKAIRKHYNFV